MANKKLTPSELMKLPRNMRRIIGKANGIKIPSIVNQALKKEEMKKEDTETINKILHENHPIQK